MENNQNNINEIDVRKILRVVAEHWWWFLIGVVFFMLLGTAYMLRKSPTWKTDAAIMLRQSDGSFSGSEALTMLGLSGNVAAEDEVVVLSSRGLMYQALDALNLWEASYVKDGLRWKGEFRNPALKLDYIALNEQGKSNAVVTTVKPTKSGYKVKTKAGFFHRSTRRVKDLSEPIETCAGTIAIHANRPLSKDTTYRVIHRTRASVVAEYRNAIKVSQHKKESNIINLSTVSPMPARDKELLTQIIEQYNLNAIVDKNLIATNTASFIEERLQIITNELNEAENAVASYKEKNNIADIDAQARLFLEASSTEQRALAEIETQLSLVEYIDEFLRDETKRNNLIPSNIGLEDASLASSLSEYNTLQLQRMRIMRTATDDNPVVDQMNSQLATMRQNIIATIGSVRESLKIRQRNIQAQDSKYNRQIKDAPEQEREYVRVVRDQQIKERLYLYLYEKREENALMLAATSMPAKIIDAPQRDVNSRNPKPKKLLFMCFLLGLIFPAGLLYLFMLFNDKIDDVKDFERRIKTPMLGQLVLNSRGTHIAIREGESTVSAELFRLIRANLKFIVPAETKTPVILISSCLSGEGKSYVASNISLSLAIMGKKVALVGLDLRQPMLAKYFNLPNKGHLTDFLAEPGLKIEDIIVPSGEHKNLDIIPCGTIAPNPAELMQTERLDALFAELRKRYDYVIVDTAPVALVSDTYLLDRVADATIFVCRFKYTPTEMIAYINDLVAQGRMHNVACVLNAVSGRIASGSYGYGYGYGYAKKAK